MDKINGISIVVCCYNSKNRLKPTIEHLANQKGLSTNLWEVIIVDNASTDDTAKVASIFWDNIKIVNKPSFNILSENKAGLSFARNRGINEAKFNYILFCDDDNWLDENYLSNSINILSLNPQIGVLGGMGIPVFEDKEPSHFWDNQYHTLAVGNQYIEEGDITNTRKVVYGAGMVLNKVAFTSLINDYNFSFQSTDRIGNSLVSCGDHEICLAIRMLGYKIYWDKKLIFYHYIPKNRTTIEYYKKLFFGFGLSTPFLIGYGLNSINANNIKYDYRYILVRLIKNISIAHIKLLFSGYYFNKKEYTKYLELINSLNRNKGYFISTLKLKNTCKNSFIKTKLFKELS